MMKAQLGEEWPKPSSPRVRRTRGEGAQWLYSNSAAGAGVTTLPSSTVNFTSLEKG